jgi:phage protein D
MMAQSEQKMDYKLTISSDSFTQSDASGLVSLVVEEHVDMIGMLVCRFSASESLSYQIGDEVKLSVGDEEVFTGFITALEPSMSVGSGAFATLRAMDPLYKLTRGRKTKQYDEMTDSDAAKQVLGDAGLSASADSTSPTHEYILQRNESDMAFLKRLAARNNFMLRMVDGKASFIKAQYSGNGTEFEFNASDSGDQAPLVSVNMAYTSTDQVQKVTVRGWDYNKKEEIVGTSTASDVDKIGDGKLGLDVCSTFGDATAYVTDVPVSDQSSADALAKSELNRLSRQFLRGSAQLQGACAGLRAGAMVTFKGLPSACNGRFFVVSTRRSWGAGGVGIDIRFCSNTAGEKA